MKTKTKKTSKMTCLVMNLSNVIFIFHSSTLILVKAILLSLTITIQPIGKYLHCQIQFDLHILLSIRPAMNGSKIPLFLNWIKL